ncbi:hypothetical protein SDC9_96116 [bioreactor metagenome]|uniref:Uncharacterized protein n=1 Tax=bioreactor metagenome TaxID=1076179 RepID=A0A645A8J2_9ZZZZ
MHAEHVMINHRLLFPLVGMDTMRHDGVIRPEAVFVVGLPILFAVGVQFLHQFDFPIVLAQVGLNEYAPLLSNTTEPLHEFVTAARRKARRQNRTDE